MSMMLEVVQSAAKTSAKKQRKRQPPKGRVCNRAGCGTLLLTRDGKPDYRRNFCGRKCLLADKREVLRTRRGLFRGAKCPLCGRRAPSEVQTHPTTAYDPGVPGNTGPRSAGRLGGMVGVLRIG